MIGRTRLKLADNSGKAAAAAVRSPALPFCSSFHAISRISSPPTLAAAPLMECAANPTALPSRLFSAWAKSASCRGISSKKSADDPLRQIFVPHQPLDKILPVERGGGLVPGGRLRWNRRRLLHRSRRGHWTGAHVSANLRPEGD